MSNRGGKREGSGRKLGAATKKTREVADKISGDGDATPLEVMIGTMRSLWARALGEKDVAAKAKLEAEASAIAKDAAPYVHPRLAAVEHTGDVTVRHEDFLDQLMENGRDQRPGAPGSAPATRH